MFIEKHQNAAGARITVTSTATNLFTLINTAASTSLVNAGFSQQTNGLDIAVEDGSIRILFDDNVPTANNGFLLTPGVYFFRNIPLSKMQLIRAGSSNVVCTVAVGRCGTSETSVAAAAGGGSGSSASQVQGNIAAAATDSGNPVKVGGVYLTTKPTYTNGQRGNLQIDANGNLYTVDAQAPNYELQTEGLAATHPAGMATSTKAITRFASTALEASRVIKASAGRLYELMGRVDKTAPTADYWVQILNAASLPADGAVTFLDRFKIVHTNGVDNVFDFTDNFGAYGSSGLVVCLSTTEFTKTISGAYLSITGKYA